MKKALLLIFLFVACITDVNAQKFYLGNYLTPTENEFELIGISSKTGVYSYKYKKEIYDIFFGRNIADIIVGIKNERIVQTIYLLVPERTDIGVPKEVMNEIQKKFPFPFKEINGTYGMNIDNESISIARVTNAISFWKDRIMFMNSVKQSILQTN
jgi:hypothetical protein